MKDKNPFIRCSCRGLYVQDGVLYTDPLLYEYTCNLCCDKILCSAGVHTVIVHQAVPVQLDDAKKQYEKMCKSQGAYTSPGVINRNHPPQGSRSVKPKDKIRDILNKAHKEDRDILDDLVGKVKQKSRPQP